MSKQQASNPEPIKFPTRHIGELEEGIALLDKAISSLFRASQVVGGPSDDQLDKAHQDLGQCGIQAKGTIHYVLDEAEDVWRNHYHSHGNREGMEAALRHLITARDLFA